MWIDDVANDAVEEEQSIFDDEKVGGDDPWEGVLAEAALDRSVDPTLRR
jgi:hypothetical protein